MTKTETGPVHPISSRPAVAFFLLAVLLVRLVHIGLLGDGIIVSGNNVRLAKEAKSLMNFGLGHADISVPPAPVFLLAALAKVGGVVAGEAVAWLALMAHLLLAVAFLYWLASLKVGRPVVIASCVFFVGLPIFNSYEGLDNVPVVFAAAGWLVAAASLNNLYLNESHKWKNFVLLAAGLGSVPLFRGEYLLFIPLYFALFFAGRWLLAGAVSGRREGWLVLYAGGFLILGAVATMGLRYADSGHFAMGGKGYDCATFLDGTPSAWLGPNDKTDFDRVQRGKEIFGDPARYDHSLRRMILANPGNTIAKFFLNLPRWAFELGRRHVVLPAPVTLLMLLGCGVSIVYLRKKTSVDASAATTFASLIATIAMTLPIALFIPYAEYLLPAFAAACVLSARGTTTLLDWILSKLAPDRIRRQAVLRWAVLASLLLGMEGLLIRGGGMLPEHRSARPVVDYLNDEFGSSTAPPILLDQYQFGKIDCLTRADIRNRWIRIEEGKRRLLPARELAQTAAARSIDLRHVVIVFEGSPEESTMHEKLAAWSRIGFHSTSKPVTVANPRDGRFTLLLLRRR